MTIKFSNSVPFLFAMMLVQSAHAHNLWIARQANLVSTPLHPHPKEQHLSEYLKQNDGLHDGINRVIALDTSNQALASSLQLTEDTLLLDIAQGAHLVAVTHDSNHLTKDKQGKWHHKNKQQVADAIETVHYNLISKTLLEPQQTPTAVADLPLQITPLIDPLSLKQGDRLPVQVTFMNHALANVKVVADFVNDPQGAGVYTNQDGIAEIHIINDTINVLQVSHMQLQSEDEFNDIESYVATLAFDLS